VTSLHRQRNLLAGLIMASHVTPLFSSTRCHPASNAALAQRWTNTSCQPQCCRNGLRDGNSRSNRHSSPNDTCRQARLGLFDVHPGLPDFLRHRRRIAWQIVGRRVCSWLNGHPRPSGRHPIQLYFRQPRKPAWLSACGHAMASAHAAFVEQFGQHVGVNVEFGISGFGCVLGLG
jgi:hypothetical protein